VLKDQKIYLKKTTRETPYKVITTITAAVDTENCVFSENAYLIMINYDKLYS